jgi:opacity protein-like surface antigen
MNKKIIAAAACGLLVSGVALADDNLNFYVGGDLGYNKVGLTSYFKTTMDADGSTFKTKAPSLALRFGARPHENFGAEVGYVFNKKLKYSTDGYDDGYMKSNSYYIDLLGYMPIDQCFELVGSIGMGRINTKTDDNFATAYDDKNIASSALRFGGGIQYKIDDHFATSLMARYQTIGAYKSASENQNVVKRITSLHLGLTYTI